MTGNVEVLAFLADLSMIDRRNQQLFFIAQWFNYPLTVRPGKTCSAVRQNIRRVLENFIEMRSFDGKIFLSHQARDRRNV